MGMSKISLIFKEMLRSLSDQPPKFFVYFFSCPFLHRTAGDTERRYHLRYFKTCMCVYETDARGCCVKNGAHCAFAHGEHDKRPPVFDIKELQQQIQENSEDTINGPNQLDKERNMMIDDPKWQGGGIVYVINLRIFPTTDLKPILIFYS